MDTTIDTKKRQLFTAPIKLVMALIVAFIGSFATFQLIRDGIIVQHGIYIDQFFRVGAAWLIAHRRVKLDYNSFA